MMKATANWAEVDSYIARLEQCHVVQGSARVADFLPPADHPLYPEILVELVLVDLELCWSNGTHRTAAEYLKEYPELGRSPESVRQLAFEEYRARRQNGEQPSPDSFRIRYSIDTSGWPTGTEHTSLSRSTTFDDRAQITTVNDSPEKVVPETAESPGEVIEYVSAYDPDAGRRLAEALALLEDQHREFLGYQLIRELGRGAFARVFLARQLDLADRLVVIKVAADLRGEPETLARLQHEHIVPIFAVHKAGPLRAFCMPYFGSVTLADVLGEVQKLPCVPRTGERLDALLSASRSRLGLAVPPSNVAKDLWSQHQYADVVLELLVKIAKGLAFAHERGVLHLDLKPANILLSDDGEPFLLDFNLSVDPALRERTSTAYIGGTLPYMSVQRLASLQKGVQHETPQDDVYSFGLIAHELLSGKPSATVKSAPVEQVLQEMIALRRDPPGDVRAVNSQVTPGLASIVAKCLATAAAERYPSASELVEDLHRQQTHQPLRYARNRSPKELLNKWSHRHPRLASGYFVGVVAAALLFMTGLVIVREVSHREGVQQRNNFLEFSAEYDAAKLFLSTPAPDRHETKRGLELARKAFARFPVAPDPLGTITHASRLDGAERAKLRHEIFDLHLLAARAERLVGLLEPERRKDAWAESDRFNAIAEKLATDDGTHRLVSLQRAALSQLSGQARGAFTPADFPGPDATSTPRELRLAAAYAIDRKQYKNAEQWLSAATRKDPTDPIGWFLLGWSQDKRKQPLDAVASYSALIALRPQSPVAYYRRGAAFAEAKRWGEAIANYDEAIGYDPAYVACCVDRGLAKLGSGDLRGAESDFTLALDLDGTPTRVYFLRSAVRMRLKNRDGSTKDRAEGLKLRPNDELSWICRGVQKIVTDPKGALADFDEALVLNPNSVAAQENKAHVLAEKFGDLDSAVHVLNSAVLNDPDNALVRAGRGVLLARQGKATDAISDARSALKNAPDPAVQYQAACVYSLLAGENKNYLNEAVRLLSTALAGGFGRDMFEHDTDLVAVQKADGYRELVSRYRK